MASVNQPAGKPVDRELIKINLARLLIKRSPTAAISSMLFALLSAALLSFSADRDLIVIWLIALFATAFLPFAYILLEKKFPFSRSNIDRFLALNTANAFAAGLAWGVGMVVLTDLSSDLSIAITFLIIFAFATAAIISHGSFPRSFIAATAPALLIYGTFLTLYAAQPVSRFGIAIMLMFIPYTMIVRNISKNTISNLISRQRNQTMFKELRDQRDSIRRANENKSRFLAATSHDLAQPLHAQGNFIVALRAKLRDHEQYELLNKIESSWRAMGNLLDGLVDISRLEAGAIVANRGPVELSLLLHGIIEEFSDNADRKIIELQARLEPHVADTDINLFSRIARNILSNAVKFTPTHGEIIVSLEDVGQHIAFCVKDTGVGIPGNKQNEIFEEYVQLDNPERDRQKGLGLGLSIVRRLCELLDIDVQMESESGAGTSFTFLLPKSSTQVSEKNLLAGKQDVLRLCILVVDDERAILDSMSMILSDWGCEVFCVESGDEALDLIQSLDIIPDAAIIDMRLREEETGLAVLGRIRQQFNRMIPAMIITGNVDGLGKMTLPGNTQLLAKPLDARTLYHKLRMLEGAEPTSEESKTQSKPVTDKNHGSTVF